MRARWIRAAALAAAVALGPPSSAAGPQIVDKADDANRLNDNEPVLLPVENPYNHNPTPVGSTPAADILSVEWRSTYDRRRVPTGFTVTMVLKAPPGPTATGGVLYRAIAQSFECDQVWMQYYSSQPRLTPQASLRHTCDGDAVVVEVPVQLRGNAIVWTVDLRAKSTPKDLVPGTELSALSAHTRDYADSPDCVIDSTRCTVNPTQFDTTRTATATYTVGK